jgi:hypothetical protein
MKKLNLIFASLFFIATTTLFVACQKETTTVQENQTQEIAIAPVAEILEKPTAGGCLFVAPDEYRRFPTVDMKTLKPISDDIAMNERASSKTLSMPAVASQGGEFSCTAFACGYAGFSYYLNKVNGLAYNTTSAYRSPENLYNNTKEKEVNAECKLGVLTSNVLNYLKNTGVCSWNLQPYSDANGCSVTIPAAFVTTQYVPNPVFGHVPNAPTAILKTTISSSFVRLKIPNWYTVTKNQTGIKAMIDNGYPVIMCYDVFTNFTGSTTTYAAPTGINRGGHCVIITGYDDNTQTFKVQNSWGTGAHQNGCFNWPYSLVNNMRELYVIKS